MMKIDNTGNTVELNAYVKQMRQRSPAVRQQNEGPPAPGAEIDKVNLSDRARHLQQAAQAAQSLPDVRADLVAGVKAALEEGAYRVDGETAAGGMLKESLENSYILQTIDIRV